MPFLSIVTRCSPGRRELLERNELSIAAQTDGDLEQIFIEGAANLYEANLSLAMAGDVLVGEYVYVLDDDDYLCDSDFVTAAKKAAEDAPDVIMVRARWVYLAGHILPDAPNWGRPPVLGKVGSPCFLVKREVWREHIRSFGRPRCGDFHFIRKLWDMGCSFLWLDRVVAEVDRSSSLEGAG